MLPRLNSGLSRRVVGGLDTTIPNLTFEHDDVAAAKKGADLTNKARPAIDPSELSEFISSGRVRCLSFSLQLAKRAVGFVHLFLLTRFAYASLPILRH